MTHQQELDDARAEMTFREDQIHSHGGFAVQFHALMEKPLADAYDAARDRYLDLLAEDRIRQLREVQS